MPTKAETINKVFKNAASKVTGEYIAGADRTKRRYAQTQVAHFSQSMPDTIAGIRGLQSHNIRLGQSSTNITAPNFYTPFTTPSAFQVPNNRKEVYLWAQWWFDNEPVVAAGIEFYTDFPLSGFELECGNGYVKDYFEEFVKKLNFSKWLPLISQEYHKSGDVFNFLSIDCEHCQGLNVNEDGDKCEHEGATWKSLTILNPDTVSLMDVKLLHQFLSKRSCLRRQFLRALSGCRVMGLLHW